MRLKNMILREFSWLSRSLTQTESCGRPGGGLGAPYMYDTALQHLEQSTNTDARCGAKPSHDGTIKEVRVSVAPWLKA
jgi:hypothetical protein